jgi:hypothetical protein
VGLGLALACGGGPEAAGDGYAAALTEPWVALALPIGDGTVRFSDGTSLTVAYPGADAATLGPAYADAIVAAGWSEASRSAPDGLFTATYARNGRTLTLSVVAAAGAVAVSLVQT